MFACRQLRRWSVALGLGLASIPAWGTTLTFTWKNSPLDSDPVGVNGASNWTSTASRSPQSADVANLVFEATGSSNLSFSTSLDVNSLVFSSAYAPYSFGSVGSRTLGMGSGGITTGSGGTGTVTFGSSIGIQLNDSQTWSIGGPVIVNSVISASSTGHLLTKSGSGTLTLNGANTFDEGLTISAGTLVVGNNAAAGTGTLSLASGTTLAASSGTITLGNHVHVLGNQVTFGTSTATGKLIFSGTTEFQTSGTNTVTSGGAQVQFGELTTNDASVQLLFKGNNAFILGGSVDESISSISVGDGSNAGAVLFANSNALHSSLSIVGGNRSSYVGVVDSAFATNTVHLGTFLSKITAATFAGTLGFDSPTSSPLTYLGGTSNALNLSAFTGSSFEGIATTTAAILSSSMVITPPSGGVLKFSALKGGILRVQAPLSSSNSVSQVGLNQNSNDSSTGAVVLENTSSNYTGGTTLKAGYLLFGANSTASGAIVTSGPLGTGSLSIPSEYTAHLASTSSDLTLHNPIAIGSSGGLKVGLDSSTPSAVSTAGNNTFELAGIISGSGKLYVHNQNGAITLSGVNTYSGGTDLSSASVIAAAANALGSTGGGVYFSGNSTVTVQTATLSVGGLDSASGTSSTIALGNGSNSLAVYQNNAGTYRGTITGTGSVSKHNAGDLTFANATAYTGGTTIHSGKVILASGATLGASTSPITLNGGALIANSGATVSNPLTLNSGSSIGGAGTFATAISVGSGVTLSPGSSPGTMMFSNGLTFASGGTLAFEINNATGTAGGSSGWDLLSISGALAVNATSESRFNIQIKSLDNANAGGNADNFNAANSYAWTFANATTVTGFDATKFTLDRTAFSNTSSGEFYLTQSGNSLLLNFTPVPEPSTYVLMGTGLSLLAGLGLRGRRFRKTW